jgi:surface antigen
MLRVAVAFAIALCIAPAASAACWKLRSGEIIETSSNSTPPVRGAEKVSCSQRTQDLFGKQTPKRDIPTREEEVERRSDDRQCVAYVRSRVRGLPDGVPFEAADREHKQWKQNLINSSRPTRGAVAIISASSAWHMAYVEDVQDGRDGASITISETNYKRGYYTVRKVTAANMAAVEKKLKIEGYYR